MASYKTAFGSFLNTEDLQGKSVPVVIESVSVETIKGKDGEPDKRVPVARFQGKDKTLTLNRTRCEQLEAITGSDDMDEWVGVAVRLTPGTTKFGGKTVGCIDIKPRSAAAAPPPPPPQAEPEELDSDSIPF